jgi:hypothetical protein
MKKILFVFAFAAFAFAGCNKDLSDYVTKDELQQQLESVQITQIYSFTINFPAVENEHFSQVEYTGLKGKVKKEDALLIYASIAGAWAQLPYCLDNTAIAYRRTDNGTLYFRYGRANYVEFSQDAQSMQMRAIVIPNSAFTSMSSKGVNMNSYEEVMKACEEMQIEAVQL